MTRNSLTGGGQLVHLAGHAIHMCPREIGQGHLVLQERRIVFPVQIIRSVDYAADIAVRELHALGLAGSAGGVDDGGDVVGGDVGACGDLRFGDSFLHPATWVERLRKEEAGVEVQKLQ